MPKCSIGFNSGEYGGKNIIFTLCSTAILFRHFLRWNVVLSITITEPSDNSGRSCVLNHFSKNSEVVVPLYWDGAMIFLPI